MTRLLTSGTEQHAPDVAADGPQEPAIEGRGLSVSFGGVTALADVSVSCERGSLTAIVGPNGAGKTTLLNGLGGMIRLSKGEVLLDGRAVRRPRPAALAALGVARSFQDPKLIGGESVLTNVIAGAHLSAGYSLRHELLGQRTVRREETRLAAEAISILDLVGLADQASTPIDGLSYGSLKLVDIARALVGRPQILMLDEPSSGIGVRERTALAEVLLKLRNQRDITILVIEHHVDLVRAIADRVIGMQAGAVVAEGTADHVLSSTDFRRATVGSAATGASASETNGDP